MASGEEEAAPTEGGATVACGREEHAARDEEGVRGREGVERRGVRVRRVGGACGQPPVSALNAHLV